MKGFAKIILSAALLITPFAASAAKGEVVYYKSGCDYFIVETPAGYSLLEWFGGYDPSDGDLIAGDIESYGMKDVYNLTADQETKVWVEEYWLSKSRAVEEYFD